MNSLEQLRADVEHALRYDMSLSLTSTDEDALRVLDAFIAEHEAVEVLLDDNGIVRRWRDNVDVDPPGCLGGENTRSVTIYAPRKQQTLAEAAERALGYLRTFVPAFDRDDHERIQGALAAALKREADNAKD